MARASSSRRSTCNVSPRPEGALVIAPYRSRRNGVIALCLLLLFGCSRGPDSTETRPAISCLKQIGPVAIAEGEDWPCFLGPRHNSTSAETGILTTWPADGLRVVWKAPLGDGFGPPAVSNGNVFHFDRYGAKARLTCRAAAT